jgi:hypothetical protein
MEDRPVGCWGTVFNFLSQLYNRGKAGHEDS